MSTQKVRFQLLRGSSEDWGSGGKYENLLLKPGEPAYNTTTHEFKIGIDTDGNGGQTTWANTPNVFSDLLNSDDINDTEINKLQEIIEWFEGTKEGTQLQTIISDLNNKVDKTSDETINGQKTFSKQTIFNVENLALQMKRSAGTAYAGVGANTSYRTELKNSSNTTIAGSELRQDGLYVSENGTGNYKKLATEDKVDNKADIYYLSNDDIPFTEIKIGDNLRGKTIVIDRTVAIDTGYPFEMQAEIFLLGFSNGWGISFDGLYNGYTFEGPAYNQVEYGGGYFCGDGAALMICEYGNYTVIGLLGGAGSAGEGWTWASEDFTFPDDQDYIVSSINLPQSNVWSGLSLHEEPIKIDCEYNYDAIQELNEKIENIDIDIDTSNLVDKTSAQTITGTKTFSNNVIFSKSDGLAQNIKRTGYGESFTGIGANKSYRTELKDNSNTIVAGSELRQDGLYISEGGTSSYKKVAYKDDIISPDTSKFVTTNTEQTIIASKQFSLDNSNKYVSYDKDGMAQKFTRLGDISGIAYHGIGRSKPGSYPIPTVRTELTDNYMVVNNKGAMELRTDGLYVSEGTTSNYKKVAYAPQTDTWFTNPIIKSSSPDPTVWEANGVYHMAVTNQGNEVGFTHYTSKDLISWEVSSQPLVTKDDEDTMLGGSGFDIYKYNLWAAQVTKIKGQLKMYCAAHRNGTLYIYVLDYRNTSTSAFYNPQLILSSLSDSANVWCSDPYVTVDNDNRVYMFYGGRKGIYCTELNENGTKVKFNLNNLTVGTNMNNRTLVFNTGAKYGTHFNPGDDYVMTLVEFSSGMKIYYNFDEWILADSNNLRIGKAFYIHGDGWKLLEYTLPSNVGTITNIYSTDGSQYTSIDDIMKVESTVVPKRKIAGLNWNGSGARPKNVYEGSTVFYHNGYWYLLASGGYTAAEKNMENAYYIGIARSETINGIYRNMNGVSVQACSSTDGSDWLTPILISNNDFYNPGHTSNPFVDDEGNWYIMFHAIDGYREPDQNLNRYCHMLPLRWTGIDCWPVFEKDSPQLNAIAPKLPVNFDVNKVEEVKTKSFEGKNVKNANGAYIYKNTALKSSSERECIIQSKDITGQSQEGSMVYWSDWSVWDKEKHNRIYIDVGMTGSFYGTNFEGDKQYFYVHETSTIDVTNSDPNSFLLVYEYGNTIEQIVAGYGDNYNYPMFGFHLKVEADQDVYGGYISASILSHEFQDIPGGDATDVNLWISDISIRVETPQISYTETTNTNIDTTYTILPQDVIKKLIDKNILSLNDFSPSVGEEYDEIIRSSNKIEY